ncbi:nicotinate-nucleotide--dimethylbenzimidazole phosphoribosyltransferase, partial [Streptomyces sp. NPDC001356]
MEPADAIAARNPGATREAATAQPQDVPVQPTADSAAPAVAEPTVAAQAPQTAAPVAEAPHGDGVQAPESVLPAAADAPHADPAQTAVPAAAAGQTAVPAGQPPVPAQPAGDGAAGAVGVAEPVVLQGPQLAESLPHAADAPAAPQPDAAVPDGPHPQDPAQDPEQPLPSGLPAGADPRP